MSSGCFVYSSSIRFCSVAMATTAVCSVVFCFSSIGLASTSCFSFSFFAFIFDGVVAGSASSVVSLVISDSFSAMSCSALAFASCCSFILFLNGSSSLFTVPSLVSAVTRSCLYLGISSSNFCIVSLSLFISPVVLCLLFARLRFAAAFFARRTFRFRLAIS